MQLHPLHFGRNLRENLVAKLMKDVEGTCSPAKFKSEESLNLLILFLLFTLFATCLFRNGNPYLFYYALNMALKNQVYGKCSSLFLLHGGMDKAVGFVTFAMKYQCVVFRPFKGEILEAVVTMVNKSYALARTKTDLTNVNVEVEESEGLVDEGGGDHEAGVEGAVDDSGEGVPALGVELVPEVVEALLGKVEGSVVIEIGIELMDHGLVAKDVEKPRNEGEDVEQRMETRIRSSCCLVLSFRVLNERLLMRSGFNPDMEVAGDEDGPFFAVAVPLICSGFPTLFPLRIEEEEENESWIWGFWF
ncbi:unnamed protein product [Prunus armeniaca]|uniref:DNA-directed RNA polymerase subunit n=1 Tax=Prunus armeniaca TaxID=36596 RepID=A0A6J5X739_PRUAR|nr:unnamed protein product [Prunus armeniaca]